LRKSILSQIKPRWREISKFGSLQETQADSVLVSHGLVVNETVPLYNGALATFRMTDFGKTVLRRFSSNDEE
jgi:hypothetical protein